MVAYMLKSIISLGILFLFYFIFLKHSKTFTFNRIFAWSALILSLTIPFISIPVANEALPILQETSSLSLSRTIEFSGDFVDSEKTQQSSIILLPIVYAIISLVLLARFSLNLINIFQTIKQNHKVKAQGFTLVLLNDQNLPFSFFRYVFVNQAQYENGELQDVLVYHEMAHAKECHSIDIIFIELLKVFMWVNPFIWLFKKQIQLNHEFLADQAVTSKHNTCNYKQLLLDLVLGNHSGILISNFNFSFTKQRLKMMTKTFHPKRAAIVKFSAFIVILFVTSFISCEQNIVNENVPSIIPNENFSSENKTDENWWQPILKEHGITPTAYNNFDHVFEMGTSNSINNDIVELENAFFLFRPVEFHSKEIDKNSYMMLRAPFATHNLNDDSIKAENGNIRIFSLENGEIKSVNHLEFSDMEMYANNEKTYFKVNNVLSHVESVDGEILRPEDYSYNISVRW